MDYRYDQTRNLISESWLISSSKSIVIGHQIPGLSIGEFDVVALCSCNQVESNRDRERDGVCAVFQNPLFLHCNPTTAQATLVYEWSYTLFTVHCVQPLHSTLQCVNFGGTMTRHTELHQQTYRWAKCDGFNTHSPQSCHAYLWIVKSSLAGTVCVSVYASASVCNIQLTHLSFKLWVILGSSFICTQCFLVIGSRCG